MASSCAKLIIADSESSADLLWATGFFVPDPIIFIEKNKKRYIALNDLEYSRGLKEANVHKVFSHEELKKEIRKNKTSLMDLLEVLLKKLRIRSLLVPPNFPLKFADQLRGRGIRVTAGEDPFFPKRAIKTQEEKNAIITAIRNTECAIGQATEVLKASKVKKGILYWRDQRLTSERLRYVIDFALLKQGYLARDTIVACGKQAADPHCRGSGPLRAHETIVIDVFPRSSKTGYHADISRTFVKGRASETVKKMHQAVRAGQLAAQALIKHGADGSKVHAAACKAIEKFGFRTERVNGTLQGFIHSTGHGLGLDVHEFPRVSSAKEKLKAGHVVTVEPGLYYPEHGGIRIEDDVYVTRAGCEVLSKLGRALEIA
jgi:Xaa-Pro aminopeptidase